MARAATLKEDQRESEQIPAAVHALSMNASWYPARTREITPSGMPSTKPSTRTATAGPDSDTARGVTTLNTLAQGTKG